ELHEIERGGVNGKVDAEALAGAFGEQGSEELAVVVLGHVLLDETDAAFVQQLAIRVDRIDHHHAGFIETEMALYEGQGSTADRAEADHHDGAGDRSMNSPLIFRHSGDTPSET